MDKIIYESLELAERSSPSPPDTAPPTPFRQRDIKTATTSSTHPSTTTGPSAEPAVPYSPNRSPPPSLQPHHRSPRSEAPTSYRRPLFHCYPGYYRRCPTALRLHRTSASSFGSTSVRPPDCRGGHGRRRRTVVRRFGPIVVGRKNV